MKTLIILATLIAYFYLTFSILFYSPKIWPDEAYLADIAQNFAAEGRIGTDLWGDMFAGTRNNFYWYPPLYIYTLAASFKIFGFSILTQRSLSIFLGGCLIIVLYILIQKNSKKILPAFLILSLLAVDQVFLKESRIGRTETLVLFLGSLAFLLYELRHNYPQKTNFLFLLSGLLSGLATITHFWGVIFMISLFIDNLLEKKGKFTNLLIGFMIPIMAWLISIYPNYSTFLEQLSLQAHFRQVTKNHIIFILQQGNIEYKIIFFTYVLLSISTVIFAFKLKRFLYLGIALLLSWIIYLAGELEWYMICIVPFIYILSALVISHNKFLNFLIVSLISILAFLNIKGYLNEQKEYIQYQKSYARLVNRVRLYIPPGSTVYLSSIPDLYFSLKDKYTLYEFPNVLPKKDKYIEVLDNSDFIVINYHLEEGFVGQLLVRYVELNAEEERAFIGSENNTLSIIKLKPRSQRRKP